MGYTIFDHAISIQDEVFKGSERKMININGTICTRFTSSKLKGV